MTNNNEQSAVMCRFGMSGEDMPDRIYRLVFGAILLLALYADFGRLVQALIAMTLIEGISNLRVSMLVLRLTGNTCSPLTTGLLTFDAERVWRLTVGLMLLLSYDYLGGALWFMPWFMGFAILGAGASGVCPVLTVIKALGCK